MIAATVSFTTQAARIAAMLFTLGLFTIGSIPTAGHAFPGAMHWVAHLATYAVIAFAYDLGWPRQPIFNIAGLVAAIGALHEVTEIVTHYHGLEVEDVFVNAIGALLGTSLRRLISHFPRP